MSKSNKNYKLALAGICGAVVYGIADNFLYVGTVLFSEDVTALWRVPEWRLMTSMAIGVVGSLLMILGFISLYRLYQLSFGRLAKLLITPSFLCIGGVLYMHYTLGVYAPLTFMSAVKAGVPEPLAIDMIQRANAYMDPLTWVLVILGYFTELVLVVGILSGRISLKKRVLLYMYGGYAVLFALFMLIGKLTGEWGLTGSLESLFETTFFIPALLYWRKEGTKGL
ncbi:MAG: hypothetical protein IJ757_07060 [Clostridiales bacterium]|nr:hypothetical protein [Clostridiales bacterium]